MADVFISYASADRERAHKIASSLEAHGWTVWWDRKLIVGQSYDQAIERELEIAKCVVVLWSEEAIRSEWVKNEAAAAVERDVLVPAFIDNIKLPLEFRRRQTADLVNWDGDPAHGGFKALCEGIAAKAANVATASPRRSDPPLPSGVRQARPWKFGAIALLVMASAAGVYWGLVRTTQPPLADGAAKPALRESTDIADIADIADSAAGTYYGDVVADSQGSSQTDVTVTIVKVGKRRVRITSDYERLGAAEVELSTSGNVIVGSGGEATLVLYTDQTPPRLDYNPGGVAYAGQKR
jgi:hypothetical protein